MPLFPASEQDIPLSLATDEVRALTRTMRRKWRDDFPNTALDPAAWTIVQAGSGHSISVANSELKITSGTTTNSETIIRSVESFTIPFRIFSIFSLTPTRTANQEIYLEIVDSTGGHYASWLLDGNSNTTFKILSGNTRNSIGTSTISSTVGSGTYQIYEIELSPDEVNFYQRSTDSSSTRGAGGVRTRQIPDPNLNYFIQIRVKNLAIAPASSTTFSIDAIAVQDIEEITTEITGGRGGGNNNQAIAVTGSVIVSGAVSVNETTIIHTETVLVLPANGSFSGPTRDGAGLNNTVRGWVFTDQSGTLIVEQSTNNTTWRQTHSFPITGNATQATPYEFKFLARYYRLRYNNGTTAQTVLEIISSMFRIGG